MYFKVKLNRNVYLHGRDKRVIETYFTEAQHFADAGMKVIKGLGTDIEVEDICLMKTFKPAANEYREDSKIFAVKVAEDIYQEDGTLIVPEVLRPYMGGKEVIKPKE